VLVAILIDVIENEPGFFLLLFELFSAGRRNPDIQRELGTLFGRTRNHVAEILKAKEREGVLNLRYDAEAVGQDVVEADLLDVLRTMALPPAFACRTATASSRMVKKSS
jgi:hypothetical protein